MENKTYQIVDSVEALQSAIARVRAAQKVFATYTQEQVDKIFLAAASAADAAARKILSTCSCVYGAKILCAALTRASAFCSASTPSTMS